MILRECNRILAIAEVIESFTAQQVAEKILEFGVSNSSLKNLKNLITQRLIDDKRFEACAPHGHYRLKRPPVRPLDNSYTGEEGTIR